ncbi:MAG: trigger factor [Acidobacteria bacterium]|nr:trigger factor [Acidobacteriota bacterium]
MALLEGCKHELEVVIPIEEVTRETEMVAEKVRSKVNLPGFRPGKAPLSMIRQRYQEHIRQEVLEHLVPRFFRHRVTEEQLKVVGTPNIRDVEFAAGEPIKFKAEFEVAPEIELKEYRGITAPYAEPQVSEEDSSERLEELRKQKADYVNLDPRPAQHGDVAVIDLLSLSGVEGEPVRAQDMQLEMGSGDTLPEFTTHILGMTPGEEKTFPVTYPEDYGQQRLAGRTVEFRVHLKMIQTKELPELNDEFAKDLGDFQSLDELKETVRKGIFRERELAAQRAAKDAVVDKLLEMHNFPVPEAYVDRQIETYIERFLAEQEAMGRDPRKISLDPAKVKTAMRDRAVREVRSSLLLERIAEREAIAAMREEVDQEIQRYAKQHREPVAAVRKRFDENGTTQRIAGVIRTEKTLNFLFEQARKEAPADG